ncbi:hypothetical protein RRG08_041049 [Elysia crispata]|uniref:Uncharacterized protein n=1 Tax=Elysia crispata TaxID=231223 RepID=A0AAE0Y8N5_9GAST|nr:hypothetical protein RRG08_041049 [Elysia crispata]
MYLRILTLNQPAWSSPVDGLRADAANGVQMFRADHRPHSRNLRDALRGVVYVMQAGYFCMAAIANPFSAPGLTLVKKAEAAHLPCMVAQLQR